MEDYSQETYKPGEGSTDSIGTSRPARFWKAAKPANQKKADKTRPLTIVASISVACAVAASAFGISSALSANAQKEDMSGHAVRVVVASGEIGAGSVIEAGDVEVKEVPSTYVSADAIGEGEWDEAVGHRAIVSIAKGTIISSSSLSGEGNVSSLAAGLDSDRVAIAIQCDYENALGGLLKIGDKVDVLSAEASTDDDAAGSVIASDATVMGLDDDLTGKGGSYTTVSIETSAEEAATIAAAEGNGGSGVRIILHSSTWDGPDAKIKLNLGKDGDSNG